MQRSQYFDNRILASDAFRAAKIITNISETYSSSVIFSRKPHIAFYADTDIFNFPQVKNFANLKDQIFQKLDTADRYKEVYLFYGVMERKLRPDLKELIGKELSVAWLENIGSGSENGGWALYRILH